MKIEIWSDIVCPFCYIGKRRIENALAKFRHADKIEVEWKSFLLNPDQVSDPSKTTAEYLSETKGWSYEQTLNSIKQVTQMAAEEGLTYLLEKSVVANPKDAHRVLQYAKTQGKGDKMKERLFKAYFTESANIADHNLLTELAGEIGLDKAKVKQVLDTDEFSDKVAQDIYESRQLEVRGVPFFVLDNKYGISGAQSPEVFKETLEKAWANFEKEPTQITGI
ncbi:MAG TPA: DsbA family oxidoreductase [Fulvivirga sp.]|nr:DsbA family oxidoreductase [Fulvivirga sp.]